MPISIERYQDLSLLSERDRDDLYKIYQEAPSWMFAGEAPEGFVERKLANNPGELFVARFNDRLLGSCWLIEDQGAMRIKWLTVRKTTRRRGVARQMIDYLRHEFCDQRLLLSCKQNSATDFLMDHCQFVKIGPEGERVLWAYPL